MRHALSEVDAASGTAWCSGCAALVKVKAYRRPSGKVGFRCRALYNRTRAKAPSRLGPDGLQRMRERYYR